jgi:hypothetical protein
MSEEELRAAIRQIQEGIEIARVEQITIEDALEASDKDFNASVARLAAVGL